MKETTSRYLPGVRVWLKVKTRETVDVIVGAVTGSLARPAALIAGRYSDEGQLVIVGRTSQLKASQSEALAEILVPAADHPWPPWLSGQFGRAPVDLVRVEPRLVVEVTADSAQLVGRWRHALRLAKLRPDLAPSDVDRFRQPG